MSETKREIHGHTVTLDSDSLMFVVDGPEFTSDTPVSKRTFHSLADAKQAVIKAVNDAEIAAISASKLVLQVLNERGEPVTVTKINRRNGMMAGLEESGRYCYPNIAQLQPLVAALYNAIREHHRLQRLLEPYQINVQRHGFGGASRVEASSLPRMVKTLQENVGSRTKAALEAAEAGKFN